MDDLLALREQSEKIRSSGMLGQSRLLRLFNFLVDCSTSGETPKEATIAAEVFDKTAAFDVSQDSSVRVYIHNLRRKLEEFYTGAGKNEPTRLVLPKGEYRLAVLPHGLPPDTSPSAGAGSGSRKYWIAAALVGIAVCLILATHALDALLRPDDPWQTVRDGPVWAPLLQNGKPIVVVIGDYYIFGDNERGADVKRLIRDFSINSKDDLEEYLQMNSNLADQYMDVGLGYLPTSGGFALASIMPILARAGIRRVQVILMSALNPAAIKSSNIIYIGLLSGLGTLQNVVFSASRFHVGDSFDELIDKTTDHHYVSGANQYADEPRSFDPSPGYRDYGFLSTFAGVEGNRIIVVASTRDEGLRQMADLLTNRARLNELDKQVAGKADFETLFEVLSMGNLDMDGKMLVASPLSPSNIWTAR